MQKGTFRTECKAAYQAKFGKPGTYYDFIGKLGVVLLITMAEQREGGFGRCQSWSVAASVSQDVEI